MNQMIITFIILLITTIFFINGKFRADLVACGSLLALSLTGIISPSEAIAGFSNSVVVMIAGLFIVGAGIFNTGLAAQIGNRLLQFGGKSETKLLLIIMLTVALFSAFMSNTGTVAVLLPVVVSMALKMNANPALFLIPLAFASSFGGVLTLIGTPPNLVVSDVLRESSFESLSFFSLTPIGLVALTTGLIYMLMIGKKLLPANRDNDFGETKVLSPSELAGLYKVDHHLHFIEVPKGSPVIGKELMDLQLPNKYGITVVAIERQTQEVVPLLNNRTQITPKAQTVLHEKDMLLLFGPNNSASKFATECHVKLLHNQTKQTAKAHFLSRRFGLTEAIITPHSSFVNKTIRELKFRKKYGCTVLAIIRRGTFIQVDAGKEKLRTGDTLLIHGEWEKIELLAEEMNDVVVIGRIEEEASTAAASGKAPIAGFIMLFMLLLMTLEIIAPVLTVLLSAFLMIVTGCLRSIGDAYKKINWESVVLIAAMLPMATALEKTGGVQFLSDTLIKGLGNFGPYAVLTGFFLLTMTLSQFISNTATAVILAPVAMTTAIQMEVSPYPFVVGVAIAASMAFSTPVASPTNALVMAAGGYTFKDFVKVGIPLQIIVCIVMIIALPLFFPF